MSILILSTYLLAACGGKSETTAETEEEVVTEEEETTPEPRDVLSGTTYKVTKYEYLNEGGEWTEAVLDPETATTLTFYDDGTYLRTFYEPDYASGDYETLSVKKEYTGEYEVIDGKSAKLRYNTSAKSEENTQSDDPEKQVDEYMASGDYIIDGDTLTYELPQKNFDTEDGYITAGGFKYTYTRTN